MIKDIKSIFSNIEVYTVYSACMFEPTYEKFKAKARSFQKDSSVSIYGFFDGESIIGVIATRENKETIEIIGISVDNKDRNAGLGTKLIDYIRGNTDKQIVAETDCDAVGFYKKYGFHINEYTVSKSGEAYTRYLCWLN
ncbi:MAG: GNAT family N-acetyltransferase [Clostridia bacterium]|nr:GNAT family N-acetyltransferase [Clostridia bacterium]